MAIKTVRRLPGIQFEARAPQLSEALPRMDVAIFVGFAASGPLDVPVAVEDFAQFTAVFGEPAPLAWDELRSEQVYAHLAPAVKAFFDNGGRRCWVIRVAGDQAVTNYFPIPALACAEFDGRGHLKDIRPAFAQACSAGSWSDALRVSATVVSRSLSVTAFDPVAEQLDLSAESAKGLEPGDLLRLVFDEDDLLLLLTITSVKTLPRADAEARDAIRVTGHRALWFRTRIFDSPPVDSSPAIVYVFTALTSRRERPAPTGRPEMIPEFEGAPCSAELRWPSEGERTITIDLDLSFAEAPSPGEILRAEVDDERLWLTVEEAIPMEGIESPPSMKTRIRGQGLWQMDPAQASSPMTPSSAEALRLDLWARNGEGGAMRLTGLGFEPSQSRYWGDLPTDERLYQNPLSIFENQRLELAFEKRRVEVWRTSDGRRFPLAAPAVIEEGREVLFFPIAMPVQPERYLPAIDLSGDPLERDGLSTFDASIFLDRDLVEAGTASFIDQASYLRYQAPSPRALRGIHAALGFGSTTIIEEATLIAVPDAVHRGWKKATPEALQRAGSSEPLNRKPALGGFLRCDARPLPAPEFERPEDPDSGGTFSLAWSSPLNESVFVIEEAVSADFSAAVEIWRGEGRSITVYGRAPGDYFYRVRAEADCRTSDWSAGEVVRVPRVNRYRQLSVDDYRQDSLIAVERAMLRMCAARGDLLAVLSLPEFYDEARALTHVETLKSPASPSIEVFQAADRGRRKDSLPLGSGEARAFSYGALYYPWLVGRDERRANGLSATPPDGAACGVMAGRALSRGAWIAPANELLRGVIAVEPPPAREQFLNLQKAQINLIRQEPRGFLVLSADTLSVDEDEDLRPINVRRLLILLRRLALRLGATYVFEPNDDSFRRLVQRGFEATLDSLFVRGAFAGATPGASYQVVADSRLNALEQEQGRFTVEIKVAPSLPMTFLTIRVIHTGDRTLVTETGF